MADHVQLPAQLPLLLHVRQICLRVFRIGIHRAPVCAHHRADVQLVLHPAFDLEAAHAALHQPRQMLDHAHIAAGEDRRAACILLDGHRFIRPRPLRQRIGPAAGLAACAPVRAAPVQEAGKHAASRMRHAHRAVDERFQLDFAAQRLRHRLDLLKCHFARQHHALRAERTIDPRRLAVRRVRLRAHMDW